MDIRMTSCCGLLELANISNLKTPEEVLRAVAVAPNFTIKRRPFVIFTGVVGERVINDHISNRTDDYGKALADYIEANGLGEVVTTLPPRKNWSGNQLKVWLWMPDHDKVREWKAKSKSY